MRRLLYVAAALAVAALMVPTFLTAQSAWRLAVPGPLTAGSLLYARDANNLGAIDAVASGQVLTSAGAGTAPAWSASPTFTSPTVTSLSFTAGGNSLTKVVAISTVMTPAAIAATACDGGTGVMCATTETFSNIAGIAATDRVFVNGPALQYAGAKCPVVDAAAVGTNQLRLVFAKLTGAACTPEAGSYHIFAVRT